MLNQYKLRVTGKNQILQIVCLLANSFTLQLFVINTYTVFVSQ
jgi:hypothetical protein